jgi:tetratricopeptide (TPR) repeat protein
MRQFVVRCAAAALTLAVIAPTPAHAQSARLLVPLAQLEATAQKDSADPLAHYDVALGYWMAKRWDDAERELRRAIAIEPKTAAAYLALAYLPYARREKLWDEERKGKVPLELQAAVEESYHNYSRAFLIDPLVDLKILGLMLPSAQAVTSSRSEANWYVTVTRGFVLFWGGQYDQAFTWFDDILKQVNPKSRDQVSDWFYTYHGLAAAHSGRYDAASADFHLMLDRAIKAEKSERVQRFARLPSNELRYVLANIMQVAGRQDSAAALYQEALANDLGLYMAHAQLANIAEENHDWNAAILERRRALETNPEDPSLAFDLGATLAYGRRYQEAVAPLQQAQAANPVNARIPYILGLVELHLGDTVGARASLERFLAIAPSRFGEQVNDAKQKLAQLP